MAGRERRIHENVRRPRSARGPARGVPAGMRSGRRRAPGRGPWFVLGLVIITCLIATAFFLRFIEGPAETVEVASVVEPASAKAPELPVDPGRARAMEELDGRLQSISREHAGVHGAVVFDP